MTVEQVGWDPTWSPAPPAAGVGGPDETRGVIVRGQRGCATYAVSPVRTHAVVARALWACGRDASLAALARMITLGLCTRVEAQAAWEAAGFSGRLVAVPSSKVEVTP